MATRDTPNNQAPNDGVDPSQYLWQLTRAHVDKVLHYTHWIPMSKGFTQQFLARNYPGWTLGSLVGLFDKAGIRIAPSDNEGASGAPHGGRCHWQVAAFYFNDAQDFHVVWDRELPFDKEYLAMKCSTAPAGSGPLGGTSITAVPAARPVDLSGERFFE
jgi:hypothetical protein